MKRLWIWAGLAALVLWSLPGATLAAQGLVVGEAFPDLAFPLPKSAAEQRYLGLAGGKTFKIPQVRAEVVIVEIFSMYCPYCQKEAPNVNALYEQIERTPALKGRIKLLGIGAGNSPFEVDLFKKRYAVPFPLVPDGDFTAHRLLGEPRTPLFVAVKPGPDGTARVIHVRLGAFEGVAAYLDEAWRAANR